MSGIYIPGMEMPTTGLYFVGVDNTNGRDKTIVTVERMLGNRDVRQIVGSFELIPVPDHGRQNGLYNKYFVVKAETGEIVKDCFVLRPQKDKAAVAALLLYAKETKNQELASDIRGWLSTILPAEEGEG